VNARDGGYPDDVRSFDHDPRSPFYNNRAEDEAAEREERFYDVSRSMEALTTWLDERWDQDSDKMREEDGEPVVADLEVINAALVKALTPWRKEILEFTRDYRQKRGFREPLVLMGARIAVVRSK